MIKRKKTNHANANTVAERELDRIISSKPVGWEVSSTNLVTPINFRRHNRQFCARRIAALLYRRDDMISCGRSMWRKIK